MPPSLLECRYSQDRRAFHLSGKATGSQLAWQPVVEVGGRLWDLEAAEDVRVEEGGGSGALLPGATATIAVAFNSLGLAWELRAELAEEGRTVTFGTVLRNLGKTTRRLGKCSLVRVTHDSGSIALGAESCELVYLNFSGDQGLHQVRRLKAEEGPQKVKHIAHLHDLKSGHTLHLGFTTFDRITTSHTFACGADGSLVALDSYCDFFGYELRPGESIATETLVLEMSTNPYVSLERWADRVNEHYQPSLPSRCPASWVGWSWVDGFNVEKYESVVLRNARAMRERLAGFELDYIWVSIGNIEGGLPGNWLKFNADLFPGGVVNLVSRLRELDLKLGFWVAPFWICSHATDTVEELRECLLRDEAGNLLVTCSEWAYGDGAALPKGERPVCYSLDGSHPKAVEFLRKVFGTYRDWGVRYYMIDFLHAGLGVPSDPPYGDHHDPTMVKGPEVYRHALQAVRDAAGSDTYLLCSSGPTVLNTGLVDAARVGNDYGEGRALYPDTYFYPATFVINGPGFWTSHKYATTNMAGTYFTHGKLYLNDSGNVMTVDKPICLSEAQIAATVFGLNGGPMMIGDDLDRMSEERLALIKKCLPRGRGMPFPLDLFDSPSPDYPKLFHLHVERDWDCWDLVAIFNYEDEAHTHVLEFERLGLAEGTAYQVWEFWNEQYLGSHCGSVTVQVPPRSARVYRLVRQRDHPWILSTDMHVRQGQFEILNCRWNSETRTLQGRATRPAGEVGNLFVNAPKGMRVASPEGLWIAKDAHDQTLIVRKELRFGAEPADFEVRFADIP